MAELSYFPLFSDRGYGNPLLPDVNIGSFQSSDTDTPGCPFSSVLLLGSSDLGLIYLLLISSFLYSGSTVLIYYAFIDTLFLLNMSS